MRIFEIAGNREDEVLIRIRAICAMLQFCNVIKPSRKRDEIEQKYLNELHEDMDNLLLWVMKSPSIASVYYSIPAQYRK